LVSFGSSWFFNSKSNHDTGFHPNQGCNARDAIRKGLSSRGRASWRAFGLEFEFIYVKKDWFWGFEKNWVNSWSQVNITDRERTVLDLIIRPELFGGIPAASEIMEGALPQTDLPRLVDYALRYDVGTVIKRLGWLLERMGADANLILPLMNYPVTGTILLDPNQPRSGKIDPSWQINEI
jgi:predicted transcriptional regulator of viral defense system